MTFFNDIGGKAKTIKTFQINEIEDRRFRSRSRFRFSDLYPKVFGPETFLFCPKKVRFVLFRSGKNRSKGRKERETINPDLTVAMSDNSLRVCGTKNLRFG
jgi:hypothetical protein